jgi:hypothetical protein
MDSWLVLNVGGILLGEVIADSHPQARALAAAGWPGRSGARSVWRKEVVDQLKKKGEQFHRRNRRRIAHHQLGTVIHNRAQ